MAVFEVELDAVPVAVRRSAFHGDVVRVEVDFTDAFEGFSQNAALETHLRAVIDVLVLTAAALGKYGAGCLDAVRRWFSYPDKTSPLNVLAGFETFGFNGFTGNDEGSEDDFAIRPA